MYYTFRSIKEKMSVNVSHLFPFITYIFLCLCCIILFYLCFASVLQDDSGKFEYRYLVVETEGYPHRTFVLEDNR